VALPVEEPKIIEFPHQPFVDPDPFMELVFKNELTAKQAIADYLGRPLAKLTQEQMTEINQILEQTLDKKEVMSQIKAYFPSHSGRWSC
jgi:hypothetical protein